MIKRMEVIDGIFEIETAKGLIFYADRVLGTNRYNILGKDKKTHLTISVTVSELARVISMYETLYFEYHGEVNSDFIGGKE